MIKSAWHSLLIHVSAPLHGRTDRKLRGDRENDVILPRLLYHTQYLAVAAQETFVEWKDDGAVVDRKG